MATLERPAPEYTKPLDPSSSAVPTPFPVDATNTTPRSDSRSPRRASLSRGVGGIMDKVKRVMSASRERSQDGSQERDGSRGRRQSVADEKVTGVDEPRGREGAPPSLLYPTTSNTHTLASRSTSRGRNTVSTGRGGAGNMRGVEEAGEGDESPDVVQRAREEQERERSESRERTGREEVVGTGRGGKGNMRSQSRGRELDLGRVPTVLEEKERAEEALEEQREKEVIEAHQRSSSKQRFTTGRGGAGNIRTPSSEKKNFRA